jgi:hypothetical protein
VPVDRHIACKNIIHERDKDDALPGFLFSEVTLILGGWLIPANSGEGVGDWVDI